MRIALACWDYDRTRAIADGRIRPEGLQVDYISLPPEETFFRTARFREFDVSELSLSSYVVSCRRAERPFVAIPVFPSRSFRHSGIYVRGCGGIECPEDLRGRRVGVAEYQLTANVWIRGIFAERHGLPVRDVTYVTGGLEDTRRIEKIALELPPEIRVEPAPTGATLSALLAAGELDAIYSPRAPSTLGSGVRRLFEDFPALERAYLVETGIFPIMHVLAIRTDVYEAHRWVARSLLKAFTAAKDEALASLREVAALKASLPWTAAHVEEARALIGEDWWPYGLGEENRRALETFLAYARDQGLAGEDQTVESLFAPETLEEFAI